jgi:putative transposase
VKQKVKKGGLSQERIMSLINRLRKRAPVHVNVQALHKLFDALILNANPFQIQNATNCRYTPKKLMHLLAYASLERHTIESTCTLFNMKERTPCASALRNALAHHTPAKIDALVNDYLVTTLKKVKRFASATHKRPSTVVIDFHDDPYYGKAESPYVVRGKHTRGTNSFFRYATVSLIEHGVNYTLGMRSVENTATRCEILKELITHAKKLVNVKVVLADAAFYTLEVMTFLDQEGITCIIRGSKTKGVTPLMENCENELTTEGAYKVMPYVMKSHARKRSAQVQLIVYRQQATLRVLAVNNRCELKARDCIRLYKKRFSIETSYRMKHVVKAWTTSKKPVLRTVLFGMSCLVYTFWALYREVVVKPMQRSIVTTTRKKSHYETRLWVLLTSIRLRLAPLHLQEGSPS